jgi:hypothetical protein
MPETIPIGADHAGFELKELAASGEVGRKSGKGFHRYQAR